jgi:multidrug efflux system outer membrane protein
MNMKTNLLLNGSPIAFGLRTSDFGLLSAFGLRTSDFASLHTLRVIPILLCALLLSGCTMAPKYVRPAAPIPPAWPSGPAYAAGTTNVPAVPELRWQEFFADEKLRQVIGTALTNNRDLRIAALNVERARALYRIQRAELLPVVNGTATYNKQQVPGEVMGFNQPLTIESYSANLGVASWELDFFGRIRSLKDRALQEYFASEQARRSGQILLVSSVANAYLALAADRESLKLSETTLEAQQKAYDLVNHRYQLGLATELDLFRAQTPRDVAQRDLAIYTQQVAKDQNALRPRIGRERPPS